MRQTRLSLQSLGSIWGAAALIAPRYIGSLMGIAVCRPVQSTPLEPAAKIIGNVRSPRPTPDSVSRLDLNLIRRNNSPLSHSFHPTQDPRTLDEPAVESLSLIRPLFLPLPCMQLHRSLCNLSPGANFSLLPGLYSDVFPLGSTLSSLTDIQSDAQTVVYGGIVGLHLPFQQQKEEQQKREKSRGYI